MSEEAKKHKMHQCPKGKEPCFLCLTGAKLCEVCGSSGRTTDCPGSMMEIEQVKAVERGELNYINGEWVEVPR